MKERVCGVNNCPKHGRGWWSDTIQGYVCAWLTMPCCGHSGGKQHGMLSSSSAYRPCEPAIVHAKEAPVVATGRAAWWVVDSLERAGRSETNV